MSSDYTGTDMFLSLSELGGIDDQDAIAELSVRALVLQSAPDRAPADRRGRRRFPAGRRCRPRSASASRGRRRRASRSSAQLRSRSETAHTGAVTWRLVNLL